MKNKKIDWLLWILIIFVPFIAVIYLWTDNKNKYDRQRKILFSIIACVWCCFFMFICCVNNASLQQSNVDSFSSEVLSNETILPSETAATEETTPIEIADTEENTPTEILDSEDGLETESNPNETTESVVSSGSYDIAGETFSFSDYVHDDVTGNWRISKVATPTDISTCALDYYNTLFSSDEEIHAIVNFTLKTTTKLSVLSDGVLSVDVYKYVDNEELSAETLFGGLYLTGYFINTETGKISEDLNFDDEVAAKSETVSSAAPEAPSSQSSVSNDGASNNSKPTTSDATAAPSESGDISATADGSSGPGDATSGSGNSAGSGDANAFNTYDNADQQQTAATYVLNTSTKKIHYPSCGAVKKIAPQNYATSSLTLEELLGQGYTTCGNCFK